jgi:plastocyanin
MVFAPAEVTIHVGQSVHWVWSNGKHNVVSGTGGNADGKFCNGGNQGCDDAPLKKAPYTYDFTFTTAGDYPYFCSPHYAMGMKGVVHVLP